jgi:hypothetical protein
MREISTEFSTELMGNVQERIVERFFLTRSQGAHIFAFRFRDGICESGCITAGR